MANIDLSSQEWCDLIFEGRNKAYGAYEMRSSSPKRHNLATLIVVVVALLAFTLPKLVRNMIPEQDMDMEMTEVTTLSNLKEAEVKQNEELKPLTQAPPPPPL